MNQTENIARGICVKDGKILLAYLKEKGYYFLPGGHVEFGESIFKTLEREIHEEMGLVATAKDLVLIFEHTWNTKDKLVHEINYILMYDLVDAPTTIPSTVDHLKFVWISLEQFDDIVFLPKEIHVAVKNILNGDTTLKFLSSMS